MVGSRVGVGETVGEVQRARGTSVKSIHVEASRVRNQGSKHLTFLTTPDRLALYAYTRWFARFAVAFDLL